MITAIAALTTGDRTADQREADTAATTARRRGAAPTMTPDLLDRAHTLLGAGKTRKAIARDLEVGLSTLNRALRNGCVDPDTEASRPRQLTPAKLYQARQLSEDGASLRQIGERTGVNTTALTHALHDPAPPGNTPATAQRQVLADALAAPRLPRPPTPGSRTTPPPPQQPARRQQRPNNNRSY